MNPDFHPAPVNGVEHPQVIDLVGNDAKTGEAVLIMLEPRPWDGSELRLFQLQEKINAYLSFALDGEMAEAYPELAGKPLRLQVDCVTVPDAAVVEFLGVVREQISFQGINLEVRVMGAGGCGPGCECGAPASQG
ncbi:MAG: hypothetical protein QOE70_6497 [Chthoniobacter sp.]|nr:hypothetical protein [Chthoniobacter sp.]